MGGKPGKPDGFLLIVVLFLTGFGLVVLYSTSAYNGQVRFGDSAYYFKKQLFAAALGLAVMYVVSGMDYHALGRFAVPGYLLSLALSGAVLLFGDAYNGSRRWLSVGPLSFQPAEYAKPAVILLLAQIVSAGGSVRGGSFRVFGFRRRGRDEDAEWEGSFRTSGSGHRRRNEDAGWGGRSSVRGGSLRASGFRRRGRDEDAGWDGRSSVRGGNFRTFGSGRRGRDEDASWSGGESVRRPESRSAAGSGRLTLRVLLLVLPIVALVGTNNLSTAVIILGIAMLMIFISNPRYLPFLWLILAGAGFLGIFLSLESYRLERLAIWRNPELYEKGYQTIQGLYAIGSGGLFGSGLGNSLQKLGFVPEAQNDMIFSVICEELGLFGAALLIILFLLLLWRFLVIALHAPDLFGTLLAAGILGHIALQVILNIAVVTNTIPNTGITLPFISYGGTSVLFLQAEMGLALSVSRWSNYPGKRRA